MNYRIVPGQSSAFHMTRSVVVHEFYDANRSNNFTVINDNDRGQVEQETLIRFQELRFLAQNLHDMDITFLDLNELWGRR